MSRIKMYCPCCRKMLKQGDSLNIETLTEHIENPNGIPSLKPVYFCSNKDCGCFHPFFSKKIIIEKKKKEKFDEDANVFWNEDGEIYGFYRDNDKEKYIDNNNAPFGTISRRLNVEIYKKNENFTLLNLFKIRLVVVFRYQANEDGEILKRKFIIETWIKDGIGYKLHTNQIRMFFFSFKHFLRKYRYYKKHNKNKFAIKELLEEFNDLSSWDKRAYRILFKKIINLFYFRTKKKIICLQE